MVGVTSSGKMSSLSLVLIIHLFVISKPANSSHEENSVYSNLSKDSIQDMFKMKTLAEVNNLKDSSINMSIPGHWTVGESRADTDTTSANGTPERFLRPSFLEETCRNHNLPKPIPKFPRLKLEDVQTEKDRIYFEKYNFLPTRSKSCDNMSVPGLDYTLVTVLLDLRREDWPHFRRVFLKYCYYAVQMLNLHAPMVIYVDPQAVDFVEYHRQGKEHFTHIIPVTIRDLEYYKYHARIVDIMSSEKFKEGHSMLHHPEGFSADYNILMNSKFSMLYHASTRNYFSTNYFYWMDVGYAHGEDVFPASCLWSPNAIMNGDNQITYIELNPLNALKSVDDIYKKFLPPFLNGAFFGGPGISIRRYYFLHKEVFESFLDEGKVDDDQTLAVACYFQNPLLFNIVEGWWYDAFTLFK